MKYLAAFSMAFTIVYVLIPVLSKLSFKIGFLDVPNERKMHKQPIPVAGGIGIFISFVIVFLLFVRHEGEKILAVLLGSLLIIGIGILDDWYKTHGKDFPALPKFIVQIASAVLVYLSGIVFWGFHNPFTGTDVVLPVWMQFFFTIMWIFGVTTVINFSDGMDGLAGGITSISATTLFIVALIKGQPISAMMAIILVGAVLGFLRYNRYPARIFMGDSGATFLGYILAIIALDGTFKQATILSIFIPVLALGVPIFDNIFVVFKRIKERKPIYKADNSQIHFRLLSYGLNQKQVVVFLYLVSLCLSLTSIIVLLISV
ncbi:MAG TPA: undecaprenyl/decaprenyl-phosphate alpha-N-acetylglucosaminyl 1-phosphate transferase [Clostridiaceae bacterium]|nr:undecaprenyl/decaprenyl-phosphate alpha-N-acetylglucosaminyl 1-phosphate transferase [Clostridiaceae bacterium]